VLLKCKRDGGCLYVFFIVLANILLTLMYLYSDEALKLSREWLMGTLGVSWNCINSWGNASLQYRDVLLVVSLQSLILSAVAGVGSAVLIMGSGANMKSEKSKSIVTVFLGFAVGWYWLCVLGNGSPIHSLDEISTLEKAFFNNAVGVVSVATALVVIGADVGKELGALLRQRMVE